MEKEIPVEAVPADGWDDLRDEMRESAGVVLLLGDVDAGKSTLARWLATALASGGVPVGVVDADVGQSSLCIPGTVSRSTFRSPDDISRWRCDRYLFLGAANPVRVFRGIVEGTGRLVQEATREAARVIIDTTGLVTGKAGLGLKLAKIREVSPDLVVAVQREEECEPILARLQGSRILRLAPSPLVRRRTQAVREAYRNRRLARFFEGGGSREFLLRHDGADLFIFGRNVRFDETVLRRGTVIGLNRGNNTIALGIVTEADREAVTFRSPAASVAGADRIVAGELRIEERETS
jgi:polynucleotide 5'-hydroxyl-kinase GRC3/NOL9